MTTIFETVQQLFEDYTLTTQGFQEAEHSANEVVAAVKIRLQEAQQANAQRIAQLEARAKDPLASETVRKVASLELARIRDGVPAEILESERELFNGIFTMQNRPTTTCTGSVPKCRKCLPALTLNFLRSGKPPLEISTPNYGNVGLNPPGKVLMHWRCEL